MRHFYIVLKITFVLTKMNDVIFVMMPLKLTIKGSSIPETFVFSKSYKKS